MAEKKVVLAIDDNLQQLSEFQAILSDDQYDLRAAKSASEAVSFVNKVKVDVVLLDIEMPNISGFEFLQDILRLPSYRLVPVIVVSINSGHEFVTKAKNLGAAGVISKPVNPVILRETIEKALLARAK
ncbi:MAG: response regulator [Treponema sp.]|jgi:PleD family two-component response regulator|nr:response regulator [Treponema sp.]